MSNEALIMIIATLVSAHYVSLVWEIRKVRSEIALLKDQVNAAALAASNAALAAATAATLAAQFSRAGGG